MLGNSMKVYVKVKCIEENATRAKLTEEISISAVYVNRLIGSKDRIVNKTFLMRMGKLGY